MFWLTGRNSNLKYVTTTLNSLIIYFPRDSIKEPYAPGNWCDPALIIPALMVPFRYIIVSGMMLMVRNMGAIKSILFFSVSLKKRNSYKIITTGRVKAISFVFIDSTAEMKATQ